MKLSELLKRIKEASNKEDPEIKFLPLVIGDTDNMNELSAIAVNKKEYFENSAYGSPMPKGEYVVLEII